MNKYYFDKKTGSIRKGINNHSIWLSKNVLWVCFGCVSFLLFFAISKLDTRTEFIKNKGQSSVIIPSDYHYCDLITDDYVFVYPSYMSLSRTITGTPKLTMNESNYITIESWDYNGENIKDMFFKDKDTCVGAVYTRCKRESNWYVIKGYYDKNKAYYKKIALNKNRTKWIKAEFQFDKERESTFEKTILEHCFWRFPIRRANE